MCQDSWPTDIYENGTSPFIGRGAQTQLPDDYVNDADDDDHYNEDDE